MTAPQQIRPQPQPPAPQADRLARAVGILMQRLANVTAELVNAQVEAEAQRERADKAEARVAELEKPKKEASA